MLNQKKEMINFDGICAFFVFCIDNCGTVV